MVAKDAVYAYPFDGYWVDVGTIQSYWETNLALLDAGNGLHLDDMNWVIHTRSRERPPAHLGPTGNAQDTLLSNGCDIKGSVIHSVLSPGVVVEPGAVVRDSVIMNDTVIRAGARVDRCVVDKEVEIGAGAQLGCGEDNIPNQLEPANLDTGITIVGKRARVPAGAIVGGNCRIDPGTTEEDYAGRVVPGGGSVLRRNAGAGEATR